MLGSRGAIGQCLVQHLKSRIQPDRVAGVDLVINSKNSSAQGITEAAALEKLGKEHVRDADIILGVIGKSIFTDEWIEDLILNGKRPHVFFASGSTKTLEFTHLSHYVEKLRQAQSPRIRGQAARVDAEPIRDPQTGLIQGTQVRIELDKKTRTLHLLGGLTPINFLYYGVPTETMDPVLTQLIQSAAGLLARQKSGKGLPPRVLAVDHEITVDAELIKK